MRSEIDLLIVWALPWRPTVGVRDAFYDAEELAVDTHKIMLGTQGRF